MEFSIAEIRKADNHLVAGVVRIFLGIVFLASGYMKISDLTLWEAWSAQLSQAYIPFYELTRQVVPFVEMAVNGWAPSLVGEWSQTLRMLVSGRQKLCRTFARILRHPMLVRAAIRIVATIPAIGRAVIRRLNKGSSDEFFDSGAGHGRAA